MIYVFGDCELDEELFELRRGGVPVKLEPKAFKVLAYLLQHRDRVVPKDELLEKLWPGEFVTEFALTRCILKARQALHDDGDAQRVIKTVHRRGYRVVAAVVVRVRAATTDVLLIAHPRAHEPTARCSPTLPHKPDMFLTVGHTPQGERKQATVLSTGVHGMAALAQALDPEALHAVFHRLVDLLRTEVHRVEGVISHRTEDGLTAVFGIPIAYENHAMRALHAALGMQQAFARVAADLQRTYGLSLALRLGVHSGPVVASKDTSAGGMDGTVQGFTIYLASCLQRLAPEGAIYASAAVQQQASGFFRFDDLGDCTIPEVGQSVRIYACTGIDRASSRLEALLRRHTAVFLGRAREMELLRDLWAKACRGDGQVVCLFGEAGVGKSRLAYEFQRTLVTARTLQARTLSYGQAMPYHLFIMFSDRNRHIFPAEALGSMALCSTLGWLHRCPQR